MSKIKWIPLAGMNLSPANLAVAERLRKFGFAVNCSEFGSEKLTKSGLCIYDVLEEKENPNILVIAPTGELYSWYRILMTTIGADFKVITAAPDALVFFDKCSPALFLMSKEALFGNNALKSKADGGFVWDLIIIDEESSANVPDYAKYRGSITWKSEKLLVHTPCPAADDKDKQALAELIKNVLEDSGLAANADKLDFGKGCVKLDDSSPAIRYYDQKVYTGLKRNVEFREYDAGEELIKTLRRRVDLRTGVPAYRWGGNIFEQYDCEKNELERAIYRKNTFTRSDVEDLCAFDKKLEAFLSALEEALAEEGSRAMVYCCCKETEAYLNKVLSCIYGADVKPARSELIRSEDILRKLRVDDSTAYPRILIGMDSLGTVGEGLDRITCVINYELPLDADTLERRMTRHGCAKEEGRRFVIFRDKNGVFDSAVLDKAVIPSVASAFREGIPTRNILFDMNGAECFVSAISELKYIRDYASQVDNCLDLIKKVKCEYIGADKIANSKQLRDFAQDKLSALCKVLGVEEGASEGDITAAVNALGGLCAAQGGTLKKLDGGEAVAESFAGDGYLSGSFASEAVAGLAQAKARIDELHAGSTFHLDIKQELSALGDSVQYPVLYGIWKYRVREQDSERSFRDYIRLYNDGI